MPELERWCTEKDEDLIGMVAVPDTTGETLFHVVKDLLIRLNLPIKNCRGQAYDGASNMQGNFKGVATRIQQEVPSAIHVHCLVHCFNHCLQDVTKLYKPVREALDSIIKNYTILLDTLQEINEGNDVHATRAGGLLYLMKKFSTFFGLYVLLEAKTIKDIKEPKRPKQRKKRKRFDYGAESHVYPTPKDHFRHHYFDVLHLFIGEITNRFDQPSFAFIQTVEKLVYPQKL